MTGRLRRVPDQPSSSNDEPAPAPPQVGHSGTAILPTIDPSQFAAAPVPRSPFAPAPSLPNSLADANPGATRILSPTPGRLRAVSSSGWLTPMASGLGLLFAEGASVGLAGWAWRSVQERFIKYAGTNDIPPVGRTFALGNMAAGALAAVLVGLMVALLYRRRGGAALVENLGRRMAPLITVGLLPFVTKPALWAGKELTMLLAIALFGLGLQRLARVAFAAPPVLRQLCPTRFVAAFDRLGGRLRRVGKLVRRARWLPWLVVLAAAAGYAFHFAFHTLQTHYRLGTASLDLGLEDNLVWNIVNGGPLFKTSPLGGPTAVHTGFHQTFFSYVIAPIYALAPRPQTLLIIQAVMIALAALPLYALARRRLGALAGVVLAVGYLLYPPVHGANLYDFHYQPLSTVFLFAALYFLVTRRNVLAVLTILLAFSLREDIPALVAVLGLYLVLTGERPRAGLVVMLVGLTWFGVQKFVIMPRFLDGAEAYVHQYKNLVGPGQRGFGGVLKTVLANPFYTLTTLIERDKLIYLLQIFTPLAFLPFRRSIGLLLCVPGFFFTLLATEYPPLIQISFQYTAYWTPFLFIACVAALERLRSFEDIRPGSRPPSPFALPSDGAAATRKAWLLAFAGATVVASLQFGAILDKTNTRGGFGPYRFGLIPEDHERHKNVHALIALVPPRAKITASEMLVAQVSGRPDAYTLRMGIYDADYLLFETPPGAGEREHVIEALRSNAFGVLEVKGPFVLAKRGHATTRNQEVLGPLGP